MRVTVIGAGIIGLTTALTLEERGHQVRVLAAATGEAITSSIAGAVWFPYQVGPPDRVIDWAARTRAWLHALAADRATGVDVLTAYEITADDATPWWAGAVPIERAPAPVTGAPVAWRFVAPRAEPALLLPWLAGRLRAPIEPATITTLADVDPDADAIVHCTGLAARELAGDPALVPLLGQVAIAELGGLDPTVTVTDARVADAPFYAIPRRTTVVLGGCARPHPPGAPAELDPALAARVLADARRLGLAIGAVRTVRVGLRPYRPAVRVERDPRDPRVIHNYGHGGAGFTLCRGCAEDVAALLDRGATG